MHDCHGGQSPTGQGEIICGDYSFHTLACVLTASAETVVCGRWQTQPPAAGCQSSAEDSWTYNEGARESLAIGYIPREGQTGWQIHSPETNNKSSRFMSQK